MPTNPLNDLLDRDFCRVAAKEVIEIASPLLREVVNYSTNAFARCSSSTSRPENEDLAVMMLYFHIIEYTDGIEVLISQSCPNPAIPLVRSSFEALLSIEYILEEGITEEQYLKRSLSWLYDYVRNRLSDYDTLDPTTDKGRNFIDMLKVDKWSRDVTLPKHDKVVKAKENLQGLLSSPQIQPIEEEYKNIKSRARAGRPPWYKLFGGPANLQKLSEIVGRGAAYEILYRNWSHATHANDLSRFITRSETGEPAVHCLRNPECLYQVASQSTHFLVEATRRMLLKFRPGEELSFSRWYIAEVNDRYRKVAKTLISVD